MTAPKLTCLFHSDTSVTALLNSPAGRALAGDLLIECAARPSLGFALNLETPASYPGVAGLLGGIDLSTLAHPSEKLPAPIVLAPGAPVSVSAVRSALNLLTRPDERVGQITFLVPVGEARSLGSVLALCERFAIAWDVATFPHEELVDFARWLGAERLVDRANFAGVHAYAAEMPDAAHARSISQLLASLGVPEAPAQVIVTG